MEKRGKIILAIIILIILVFISLIFVNFIYSTKCKNLACWEYKLLKCERASFNNEKNDVSWLYQINGKRGENCEVNVKLIEIRRGLLNSQVLEGKEMICNIPLKLIASPEANTNWCHGALKEDMQSLIINKLHNYIVENLGQINDEYSNSANILNEIQIVNQTNSTI